jgi:hypothetical protein
MQETTGEIGKDCEECGKRLATIEQQRAEIDALEFRIKTLLER